MRRLRSPRPAALAAAALAALLSTSCYVAEQGLRYLGLRSRAVSVERALADPATSAEERLLLERAAAVREFGLSELGLERTRSYTSIVELGGDRLATVVQACAELSFDRFLWSYPLVGKLPYRGYFDPAEAAKEKARLEARGYDAIARPVDAFSTLGYLADPLFSFMSSYDEAEVAELVLHEMTHATVFVKGGKAGADADQFNEELATFVGREGSLLYLARTRGAGSPEIAAAKAGRRDAEAFAAFLAGTARELEAVYSSGAGAEEKRRRKAEVIAARAEEFRAEYSSLFSGDGYRDFPMGRINNAYLDLYRLYEGDSPLYGEFLDKLCGGDLRAFVARIKAIAKASADPKAEMRRLLAEAAR